MFTFLEYLRKCALTKREQEITVEVCLGYNNQQVADKLKVSLPHIKTSMTTIMKKLNVKSRAEMIVTCYNNRFLKYKELNKLKDVNTDVQ